MPPRPIHKWKTLWLGLLILAFLTWAWARGRSHEDLVSLRPGTQTLYLGNSAGYLRCGSTALHTPSSHPAPTFDYYSIPSEGISRWFPPPITYKHVDDNFYIATVYSIAHWLITSLFFLGWASFLLWRTRRLRLLTAPQTFPQAEPAP